MAAGCHPGFDRTGNSVIRSADPENPTLERNMKWIGWPVVQIWPFEIRYHEGCIWDPNFFREGDVVEGRRSYHWKERCWFLYALHCDHCAISDRSATICHRMSATLNSMGVYGSLWVKILGCSLWSTSRTDRLCRGNTALWLSSRGKNKRVFWIWKNVNYTYSRTLLNACDSINGE